MSSSSKEVSTTAEGKEASVAEDKQLLAEYRKENVRLQNLIAKNQVAYESELNRMRAEMAAKVAPTLNILLTNADGTHTKLP